MYEYLMDSSASLPDLAVLPIITTIHRVGSLTDARCTEPPQPTLYRRPCSCSRQTITHFGSACMMSHIPYQTTHSEDRGTDSSNHGVCMLEVLHTFTRKDRGKTSSTRLTCVYSCRLSLGYFDNKCRGFFSPHTSLASA